jgi:condensation domain-containing protein
LGDEHLSRLRNLSPAKRALLLIRTRKALANAESGLAHEHQVIPRLPDRDLYLLSYAQQRMWFVEQLEPGNSTYNNPVAVHLKGPLDLDALNRTLNEIVRRHETLRTNFVSIEGRPYQIVSRPQPLSLKEEDLCHCSEAERNAETLRVMQEEAKRPFDLTKDRLLRGSLLKLADDECILLLTMHHIISDAWSKGVLIREVSLLYTAFSGGSESPLEELPIQYRDFAQWQQKWLEEDFYERQLDYWRRQLAGAQPLLPLRTDYPHPVNQGFAGHSLPLSIPAQLSRELRRLSRQHGATLFMTLMSAFNVLLHHYTHCDELIVGTDVANRSVSEVEGLIGLFVNQVVLRTDMLGDLTFDGLLAGNREQSLNAFANQHVPFDRVIEALKVQRNLSHHVLFQVMFGLQNAPMPELSLPGVTLRILTIDNNTSPFDLSLYVMDTKPELTGSLRFKTGLFRRDTISRMLEQFQMILSAIVNNPQVKLSELDRSLSNYDTQQRINAEETLEQFSLERLRKSHRRAVINRI